MINPAKFILVAAAIPAIVFAQDQHTLTLSLNKIHVVASATASSTQLTYAIESTSFPLNIHYKDTTQAADASVSFALMPPAGQVSGTEFTGIDLRGGATFVLTAPAQFQAGLQYTSNSSNSNSGSIQAQIPTDREGGPSCDFVPNEGQTTPASGPCLVKELKVSTPADRGEDSSAPNLLELDAELILDPGNGLQTRFFLTIYYDYAAPTTACTAVSFDHIEVVQTIQHSDNSLTLVNGKPTLVAGKPTVARVFMKLTNPPDQPVSGVTAVLHGFINGNELGNSPIRSLNADITIQNAMPRSDETKSLNFRLPDDWIGEGQLSLEADVAVPPCATRSDPLKFTENTSVAFQSFRKAGRTSFTIAWIPYRYQQGGTLIACPNNMPTCPDESTIPTYDYVLKKLYPLSPDSVTFVRLDVPPSPIEVIKDDAGMSDFLTTLKKFYLSSEARFYDVLLAILPSLPQTFGISESVSGRVSLIEQSHLGDRSPLENGSNETHWNADTIAHEVGHLLGRPHTNNKVCTPAGMGSGDVAPSFWSALFGDVPSDWPYDTADVQEVGFDIDTKKATPATYGDMMSYCRQLTDPATGSGIIRWISPFTYNKLISGGLEPGAGPSPSAFGSRERAALAPATSTEVIVSGWAKRDGSTGALDPVYQVNTSDTPSPSQDGGSHCIHFAGASGALGDFCFTLSFGNPDTGAPIDTQHFAFKIPLPGGTTRMSLVTGGKELAALSASAQPPSLTIASPHSGDQWTGGAKTISWSGSNPAGGSLVYSVLYSSDGGQSWLPLAMDITDSQFTLDASQIKGGQNVFLRVMASSGLNSTSADVGPINLVQTPSVAASTGKLNFAIQSLGDSPTQTVTLSNTGTGPLTVNSFELDNPVFRVVAPSTPLKIRAGSSAAVLIQWLSSAGGPVNGSLTISSDDPANNTLKVSLAGVGPVSGSGITVTPSSLDFGIVAVGQQSAAQTIKITNTGSSAATVNLSTLAPFAVSPPTVSVPASGGTAMASVTFAPMSAAAATGNLTVTVGSQSSLAGFVSLTGLGGIASGGAAVPKISGIANGASFLPKLARGSLGSIFGSNFTNNAPASASSLPLPKMLNGVSVTVGGVPAPLIYVGPGQINFQAPYEVPAGSSAAVIVTSNGISSPSMSVPIADYAVGVFTYTRTAQAVDPIIVHNSTNALVSPSSPAAPNEYLIVYATGIGKLNSPPATGAGATGLASAVDTPTMTVGGAAAQVLYAGLTPGFPGLVQFNVQLPASLPSGNLPLVITFPGDVSPSVNLAVQGNAATTPNLSLSTTSLAFGNVTIGQKKDLPVVVTNSGSATLAVSSAMVTGAGFSLTTAASFTVAAGATQTITVRYAPVSASLSTGTLTIASNDPVHGSVSVVLSGSGVAAANVILSDSFNRANSNGCSLGPADLALGGGGTHFYLPIFPGSSGPVSASIVSGALQNNGQDFGGVQLTGSAGACTNAAIRGETLPQDLNISVDLLVPKTGGNITLAGPYFRSRAAAAGDGIIGGSSAGYWVELVSTGEVRIQGLNPNGLIATSGPSASFDASATHRLETAAQGSTLQVALDGNLLTFTQNGTAVTTVALPATNGNNNGTAGIGFGAPDNRGQAGGQRATNLVITSYTSLGH